jgi:hypothetical protein
MRSIVTFVAALLLPGCGVFMFLLPVRFSKLLHWLAEPQLDLLRGGSLFDMYWPDRVERSRSVRIQIRILGVIFIAFGVTVALSR